MTFWCLAFEEQNFVLRTPKKDRTEQIDSFLKRGLISKKKDGNYYFSKPTELTIRAITKDRIEFGTENGYSIWKKKD